MNQRDVMRLRILGALVIVLATGSLKSACAFGDQGDLAEARLRVVVRSELLAAPRSDAAVVDRLVTGQLVEWLGQGFEREGYVGVTTAAGRGGWVLRRDLLERPTRFEEPAGHTAYKTAMACALRAGPSRTAAVVTHVRAGAVLAEESDAPSEGYIAVSTASGDKGWVWGEDLAKELVFVVLPAERHGRLGPPVEAPAAEAKPLIEFAPRDRQTWLFLVCSIGLLAVSVHFLQQASAVHAWIGKRLALARERLDSNQNLPSGDREGVPSAGFALGVLGVFFPLREPYVLCEALAAASVVYGLFAFYQFGILKIVSQSVMAGELEQHRRELSTVSVGGAVFTLLQLTSSVATLVAFFRLAR